VGPLAVAVACRADRDYLQGGAKPAGPTMSQPQSHSLGATSRLWIVVGTVVVLAIAGTLALWAHYGTAVFYEMILAGIAACF
jgi:hypothetical protein